MRLIILLAALLIVGLLVLKSMHPAAPPATTATTGNTQNPPAVPTTPQGVPTFEKDMNHFVNKAEQAQKKQIQQATQ